jgi:hypothetical protein
MEPELVPSKGDVSDVQKEGKFLIQTAGQELLLTRLNASEEHQYQKTTKNEMLPIGIEPMLWRN